MTTKASSPSRFRLVTAFATVYVIWGSTYLAIRYAVETIPPFLMGATRFLIAGVILYAFARRRDPVRLTRANWVAAAIVGSLLLAGGIGAVIWAQQTVPSGIAALLVAAMPFWMVMMDWARPGGRRPRPTVFVGLALGLIGVAVLIGPDALDGRGVDPMGAFVILAGSVFWAAGSIYSRHASLTKSSVTATAMEMLCGGGLLALFSLLAGEPWELKTAEISLQSVLGVAYLIVFGSIIAFTAFIWLLKVSTPARVGTYAYVNPVVAVLLGWLYANEPVTLRTLAAAAVIVAAVAILTTAQETTA